MSFYVYSNANSGVVRIHRANCSVAARPPGELKLGLRQGIDTIEAAVALARELKLAQGGGRIEGCGLCGTRDLV